MCSPAMAGAAISAFTTAISTTNQIAKEQNETKTEKLNNQYRAQVAINNIKQANNEAKELQQTGIEKSRLQKIEGLRQIEKQKAQNSANGFSLNSTTNNQNYDDILSNYNSNAQSILDDYNSKADNYFNQANNYLNQYNYQTQKNNQSHYKTAINSLGGLSKVATNWYLNNSGGNYDNF